MNILLLSAYDAVSHQYWRKGLVANFPEHEWTVLTLPARFFAWRVRGNSLSWAFNELKTLQQAFDLIICTSMTDLSALKGFLPQLANIPSLVYFHENQFEYPSSGKEYNRVEPQMLSIYTALAATRIAFNSDFNRQTFLKGASKLLKKLPDQVPANLIELIKIKAQVLPVPLNEVPLNAVTSQQTNVDYQQEDSLHIVWNHRWEFDKGPELLKLVVEKLITAQLTVTIHIVGQRFRYSPETFDEIYALFDEQKLAGNVSLGRWGFIEDKREYQRLLSQSDIVLSTAKHDFQGLSVLEAVQAGCLPLVPDALAYPEIFEPSYSYSVCEEQLSANNIVNKLSEYVKLKAVDKLPIAPKLPHFLWSSLKSEYAQRINETVQFCNN